MLISKTTHRFPPFVPSEGVLTFFGLPVSVKQDYRLFVPLDLSDPSLAVHLTTVADPLVPVKSIGVYDALFIEPLSYYLQIAGTNRYCLTR